MNEQHVAVQECPSCSGRQIQSFYEVDGVPTNSVLQVSSRTDARAFPTGSIRLGFCAECGFVFNTAFRPELVEYCSDCEETQGFSPFFSRWQEGLAERLIERYSLRGKLITEVGCGKGEFLSQLCESGGNRGVGFDPAYVPGRTSETLTGCVRFVREFFTRDNGAVPTDFLCCKMTLEHISGTAEFLDTIRDSLNSSQGATVFFQVPDVRRILEEQAFWDIYYEHCSYFSAGSLSKLFRRAGFQILEVAREYHNQYLTIEARVGGSPMRTDATEDDVGELKRLIDNFTNRVPARIAEWRERLETCSKKGLKAVVWGAGSKGVSFVSMVDRCKVIQYVVDINPNMWGNFLPISGAEIISPNRLRDYRPDLVIVMNPIYQEEIVSQLAELNLHPEVVAL